MNDEQPTAGTRDRLLEAAVLLMRQSGLSGAGINEIVRESGAPKGSVYHFFPGGKQQIAAEALQRHKVNVSAFIDGAMGRKRAPAEKVRALFDAFAARFEQGEFRLSCPAGTVCLDLDEATAVLRPVVASTLDAYVDVIQRHLPFGDQRRSRAFAGLLLSAIEGAYIRGRAEQSSRAFTEAGACLAELARLEATR
jgi:TetR/AcrR family transcriptional regulator, lmrAB and yxaGH operons repressor